MKIVEGNRGELMIEGDEVEYAKELYAQGDYIGAFGVLGAYLETLLETPRDKDFILKSTRLKPNENPIAKLKEDLETKELHGSHYRYLVGYLRNNDKLSKEEAERLYDFGKLRNWVIHRIVKVKHLTYSFNIITLKQVQTGFEEGISLVEMVKAKFGTEVVITTIVNGIPWSEFQKGSNVPTLYKRNGVPKI